MDFYTEESWKTLWDNPRYEVSDFGRIYDRILERNLYQTPDRAGYLRVKLRVEDERKTVSVHRLVAKVFFDFDISNLEINHIDGDKTNNYLGNLEVCDRSTNMIHAFNEGLANPINVMPKQIRIVETGEIFDSTGQVDRYLGVSSGSVSKTIRGLQPTCRGYTFEVIEIGGGASA